MNFDSKFDHREPDVGFPNQKLEAVLKGAGLFSKITNIEKLSGGYSQLNFKFGADDSIFVLRVSDKPQGAFEAEVSLLEKLSGVIPVPKVIFSEAGNSILGRHISIQEFVPGQLLSGAEDGMSADEISSLGSQLGKVLAKIHSHEFDKAGFFGAGMRVEDPFPSFEEGYFGYMEGCLKSDLLQARLGIELYEQLLEYIRENVHLQGSLLKTQCLTHSDFNQKNILVDKVGGHWKLTGIMDWEFAYSGCPLGDFANFFRYENEMSPYYQAPMIEAYKRSGGVLEDNWKEKARYQDLLPMIQFLTRKGEYPKTIRTAKAVIEETVGTSSLE